jgi:hypothetical protein
MQVREREKSWGKKKSTDTVKNMTVQLNFVSPKTLLQLQGDNFCEVQAQIRNRILKRPINTEQVLVKQSKTEDNVNIICQQIT